MLLSLELFAQSKTTKTQHVVLVTLDGLRWQELFRGADSLLVDDTGMVVKAGSLLADFWHADPLVRRPNPNKTFLEHLNERPAYRNKVMAFGGWDVFPFIINETRSGIPVNSGFVPAKGNPLTESEKLLNRLQQEIRGPWESVRLDPFTHHYALEALRVQKPSILYLAYGETDDWAHDGKYDEYLKSAKQTDAYLKEIWETLQADPHYRGKTTMLITVDHGRGTTKDSWKSHGADVPGAGQVWLIAIGPDTPALGEIKQEGQWHSAMLPRTIFQLLGLDYPDAKAAQVLPWVVGEKGN